MKKLIVLAAALSALVAANASNIAAGASVTLNGTFFTNSGGWSIPTPNPAPSILTDGFFQADGTQWDNNSVWWNGSVYSSNNIVIDLNGTFNITGFTVQADDNDTYLIEYLGTDAMWHNAWQIPPPGGWGLTTSSTVLGSSITATELRFTSVGGDGLYAVDEIQAEGTAVGAPDSASTLSLLAGALGLVAVLRRRRA